MYVYSISCSVSGGNKIAAMHAFFYGIPIPQLPHMLHMQCEERNSYGNVSMFLGEGCDCVQSRGCVCKMPHNKQDTCAEAVRRDV